MYECAVCWLKVRPGVRMQRMQPRKPSDVSSSTAPLQTINVPSSPSPLPTEAQVVSFSATVGDASEWAQMVGYKNSGTLASAGGIRGLAEKLESHLDRGVETSRVPQQQHLHGKNKLPDIELESFLDMVKETLSDKTMLILIGAAVISLFLGMFTPDPRTGEVDRTTGWIEGAAILISVAIVTVVSAVNNFQKQKQFAQLSEAETVANVAVVRDGQVSEIANEEVVVGDVVVIYSGMSLSFDAIMFEGTGFTTDESSVTGENDDVHKDVGADPFLLSGTHIIDGCDGLALVVAVGQQSFSGAIAMATRETKRDTPLQEQLTVMADTIGRFGLAAAVFTFVTLAFKELWVVFMHGGKLYAMKFFENLTTAVAIVVVAVPEGLPLSVTLSLAYSMKQMLADMNLVRHLAACETMGGATCICTDKTGTLTSNDMTVASIFCQGAEIAVTENSPISLGNEVTRRITDCIALNYGDTFGNKTAHALLKLCERMQIPIGYDAIAMANSLPRGTYQRFAFSSLRKRGSVIVSQQRQPNTTEYVHTHYVIGAAELILQKCTSSFQDGQRSPLTVESKTQLERVVESFAGRGWRTLLLAFSDRTTSWSNLPRVAPEDPLTLLAVVGIVEPLRAEVAGAIGTCISAGIRVRMVTGDHLATAISIAKSCGILEPSDDPEKVAITGAQFREKTDAELIDNVLPTMQVLARATPLDKKRLVELLTKDPTAVVAVTGDGTNDAPALKAADVGFAMNSGSDISKKASDIVLLNDNFVGVVKAVMWGRNVRDNIRKFLQFQLTVNAVACIVAFLGALINTQNLSPLKPVQLLWLNLIMDTFAALALATELPSASFLLSRNPEPRTNGIINREMIFNIVTQASFQLCVQLLLLAFGHRLWGLPYFDDVHVTMVFNVFVLMQVFNFFNARLLGGNMTLTSNLSQSHTLLYIVFVICVLQVAIVQRGGKFMSTVPLSREQWVWCVSIAATSLPVGAWSRSSIKKHRGNVKVPTWMTKVYYKVMRVQEGRQE